MLGRMTTSRRWAVPLALYLLGIFMGAIDTGIDSTPDGGEFDYYTGGTYRVGPNCTDGLLDYCSNVVDHAVALIGWDDAPAEGGAGALVVLLQPTGPRCA